MIYPNGPQEIYFIYILKCHDDSFYVGLTNDLQRRIEEHEQGLYIYCYTFKRLPVKLVYFETLPFLEDAVNRDAQLKKWSRKKKEALIQRDYHKLQLLAQSQNLS